VSFLAAATAPVVAMVPAASEVPWGAYFFQTFYHMSTIPLLVLTLLLAWLARPSTGEEMPRGFRKFQVSYLAVWCICVAADWLQGPYVYALYAAYEFKGHEIAQLFVAGFGSSLIFGMVVGSLADRFGRKKMCLAYCVFYILSCCTKHCKHFWILMVGRITGGIATSMLFSCFECWLVSEHCSRHKFSNGLLSYMFGLMFSLMYCMAIVSGLFAQGVADTFTFRPLSEGSIIWVGGYCGPFDLAILCNMIGMILIAMLWEENYGGDEGDDSSMLDNLKAASRMLVTDKNMVFLCLIVACFEGAMFAFVFNWTPALDSEEVPPPHGLIFALFMMACMCGASVATIIDKSVKPAFRLMLCIGTGVLAFAACAFVAETSLQVFFGAFLVFEFCCGLYFPSIGVLKSELVPEHVRGTMYNLYRVPLNGVVVLLLLGHISLNTCFSLCAILLTVALLSVVAVNETSRHKKRFL
jgi:MFS family permease